MPASRFIGYFLALAACSTLAFASFGPDSAAPQDTFASGQDFDALSPLSVLPLRTHRHKSGRTSFQAAHAEIALVQQ